MFLISACSVCIVLILVYGSYNKIILQNQPLGFANDYRVVISKKCLFLFCATLIFTSAVRHGFIDTYAYRIMYTEIRGNLDYMEENTWGIEPAWFYLLYLMNYITPNPILMLFVCAFIVNVAFIRIIEKYSADVILSLIIYYALVYMNTNNGLRQYFAGAITILAFPLLAKRKFSATLIYILLALLAAQFHGSAYFCVLIPLVISGKVMNARMLSVIGICVTFLFAPGVVNEFLEEVFQDSKYVGYLEKSNSMGIMRAVVNAIIPGVLVVIHLVKSRRLYLQISYTESLLINAMAISIIFYLMSLYMQYWARFGLYTSFALCAILPKLLHNTTGDRYYKLYRSFTIICYFFYFAYNIYVNYNYGAMDDFYIDIFYYSQEVSP